LVVERVPELEVTRPQRVDAKHVGNESKLLVGLVEQRLDAVRRVAPRRDAKPRRLPDRLRHAPSLSPSLAVVAEAGSARLRRLGNAECGARASASSAGSDHVSKAKPDCKERACGGTRGSP